MSTNLRKIVLGTMIAALFLTVIALALPLTSASAAGASDNATPPAARKSGNPAQAALRLEMAFARQQYNLQRIGLELGSSTQQQTRVQKMIETAKANGKDTSALQTALDALNTALTTGQPLYDQAKTAANTHAGFDASGKVSDAEKAKATLNTINLALQQYRQTVGSAIKNLRTASDAFRQANPRPTKTPVAPTSTGG